MQRCNARLNIKRLPRHLDQQYEIKDPAIVKKGDGTFLMFASIGNSISQQWLVGRFAAERIDGEWQELAPVSFSQMSGPQLCAPAVVCGQRAGVDVFTMYIQTACFEENGVIAVATSTDGQHFTGLSTPVATRDSIEQPPAPVVGVYDVAVSDVRLPDQELICMLYSGYRRVGCGDLYLSSRPRSDEQAAWSPGRCILSQETVPFHNRPDSTEFEWGLEGAKLIQLAPDCFVLIGVCFLPKPNSYLGSRQRVFMAAACSLNGPFVPLGLPFLPRCESFDQSANQTPQPMGTGENGHPDTFIEGQTLWVMYQERNGQHQPWYLRLAALDLVELEHFVRETLSATDQASSSAANADVDHYHFERFPLSPTT